MEFLQGVHSIYLNRLSELEAKRYSQFFFLPPTVFERIFWVFGGGRRKKFSFLTLLQKNGIYVVALIILHLVTKFHRSISKTDGVMRSGVLPPMNPQLDLANFLPVSWPMHTSSCM
jgi:hypothetical protein